MTSMLAQVLAPGDAVNVTVGAAFTVTVTKLDASDCVALV